MLEVRTTACNRDCPDACTIRVTVEDGRAVRLQGDPDDPVTRGFLCERTARFLDRQYAADRITTPLLRHGGRLVPIGWDEALDLAASRLLEIRRTSGPAAILHYRSGGSLGLLKNAADFLFEQFGPVTIKRGDVCSGAGEAANEEDFGVSDSNDLFDLLHSRLIVLWGKNPHTSGPHLLPVLNEARRRGAKIVGIDPVRTRAAQVCDRFLRPRPGADGAVALAVGRHLFEVGGDDPAAGSYCEGLDGFRRLCFEQTLEERARAADVPEADLREFADLFARERPAAILVGWGMGRRRNGSSTIRTLDALGLISGNVGVRGGGVSYYFRRRAAFDLSFIQGEAAAPRTLAEARLGEEILAATDPPIRAIWVTAGNPVSMLPDSHSVRRAFERSEFNVVVDTHPTDTTDVAHLVLPCPTLLEDDDLLGAYGNHWLRVSRPAIAAPVGVRHEIEILHGLAVRVGLGDRFPADIDGWKRRLLGKVAAHGVTPEALAAAPIRNPLAPEVLFADRVFPTADGRAHLLREAPAPAVRPGDDFPLLLLAASTPKGQSSQWSVPIDDRPMECRVHPSASRGIEDGGRALLESRHGRLPVTVRHDEGVRPDVALAPKGGMLRHGRGINTLIAACETDRGGGAAYYDEPVRLVRA